MKVSSITGADEIRDALTAAMHATVDALVEEKVIDRRSADEFCASHYCELFDCSPAFRALRKLFGISDDTSLACIVKAVRRKE